MEITPEQKEQLLKRIREKVPIWDISAWLMKECGLSFKEATLARKTLEKELAEKNHDENLMTLQSLPVKKDEPWTVESLVAEDEARKANLPQ